MSKGAEAKKESHGPQTGGKPEGGHPQQQHKPEAPAAKGAKGHNPGPDGCHAWGCKAQAKQFNFCLEHYDHFKFGLIKKTGEPVPDYEKKFEHYQAHKSKHGAQRVA